MGRREDRPRGAPPIAKTFDACYLLNCDADTDRLARITARLDRLGILFERFEAAQPPADLPPYKDPDLKPGHWACGLSHLLILREIYRAGFPRALILEDDCLLRDDLVEQLAAARDWIESADWDLLYLGCHAVRDVPAANADQLSQKISHSPLVEVLAAYHTHAYAVRLESIPKLMTAIAQRLGMLDGPFDEFRFPGLKRMRFRDHLAIQEPAMGFD